MTISRRTFNRLVGATAALPLVGASQVARAQEDERPVLRYATNAADMGNLDPHFAVTYQDRTVVDMVFNGIVRFVPGDSTTFEPDLAAEMPTATTNDDGTQTWTVNLRDNVTCHATESTDAYTLTSEDIVFSLEKVSDPATSAFSGDYTGWTAEAVDDFTVNINLPDPVSETLFLTKIANYSGGYVVPKQSFEAIGSEGFITNPAGTGPFRFVSHTPQDNITLEAHDEYFRGAPKLGGVEVRYVADITSRELALQSGDIHAAAGLGDQQWVDRMNEMDGIVADVYGVGEVTMLCLDTEHEILSDPRVREAIFLSISRENHVALFGSPVAAPVYSTVPIDFMPGGLTQEEAAEAGVEHPQDIDRAIELLAEAGYPDGFELELVTSELELYKNNYEVLAEELRQIGITINLEVMQHAAMHDLIREGRNAIVIYLAYRPTADTYLTHFYASDSGDTNFSNFNVDELRDQARAELDPDVQADLWKQANIEIQANFAGTGLTYINLVSARTDALDWGHELIAQPQLYPGINETTTLNA